MTTQDHLSKQDAFLLAFPEILDLRRAVAELYEKLKEVNCYEIVKSSEIDESVLRHDDIEEFKDVIPALEILEGNLAEEFIRCLPVERTAGIQEAIERIRKAIPTNNKPGVSLQYLSQAHDNLESELVRLVPRQA